MYSDTHGKDKLKPLKRQRVRDYAKSQEPSEGRDAALVVVQAQLLADVLDWLMKDGDLREGSKVYLHPANAFSKEVVKVVLAGAYYFPRDRDLFYEFKAYTLIERALGDAFKLLDLGYFEMCDELNGFMLAGMMYSDDDAKEPILPYSYTEDKDEYVNRIIRDPAFYTKSSLDGVVDMFLQIAFHYRTKKGSLLCDDSAKVDSIIEAMREKRFGGKVPEDPVPVVTEAYCDEFFLRLLSTNHIFWSSVGAKVDSVFLYHKFAWHYRATYNVQSIDEALYNCFADFLRLKVGDNAFERLCALTSMPDSMKTMPDVQKRMTTILFKRMKHYQLLCKSVRPDLLEKDDSFLQALRLDARRSLQFSDGLRIVFSATSASSSAAAGTDGSAGPSQPVVRAVRLGPFDPEPDVIVAVGGKAPSSHVLFPPLTLTIDGDERLPPLLPEHSSLGALRALDLSELIGFYEAVFGDSAGAFINLLAGNIAGLAAAQKWLIILYNERRDTGKTFALAGLAKKLLSPTLVKDVVPTDNEVFFSGKEGRGSIIVKYGRAQFLIFDDVTEGKVNYSELKKFQSAYRTIQLPDTRGVLDSCLVQPMFAISTNVSDPAKLFKSLPGPNERKGILLVEAVDPPAGALRDPRVERMSAELLPGSTHGAHLRGLFVGLVVQAIERPRDEKCRFTLEMLVEAESDLGGSGGELAAPAAPAASGRGGRLEKLGAFMADKYEKTDKSVDSWKENKQANITFLLRTGARPGPFLFEEFNESDENKYATAKDMIADLKALGYEATEQQGILAGMVGIYAGKQSNVVFARLKKPQAATATGPSSGAGPSGAFKRPRTG